MTIGNSINAAPPVITAITFPANVASGGMGVLTTGSTTSWQSNTLPSFLTNIVTQTSPAATETLLIGASFSITVISGIFATNPSVKFYIGTDQSAGSSGSFDCSFALGGTNVQSNCFVQIPVLVNDIKNAANTKLVIKMINNTGVSIDVEGISRFMTVTYLYNGLAS